MTLITADFILTCNEHFEIIEEGAVLFDAQILEVGKASILKEKHPTVTCIETPKNSVLLPGLINSHVHLEFSANQSMLHYGDFIPWLQSVIAHRDELSALATTELITCKLTEMLKSGTTSLGAISSFGADLEACVNAPQRVVYFNEVLGSVPSAVDVMYNDFRGRLEASKEFTCKHFIPAISVHSPYSTHPILAKKALKLAEDEDCVVSTHFMESQAERAWIDEGSGDFQTFFTAFNPHAKPMCTSLEYLALFENNATLFTHGVQASKEELETISKQNATLTHCPVSNRLLGVGKLDVERVENEKIKLTLGTDGLSSNISLSLWDEMRSALMMHTNMELNALARTLLQSVTCNAAHALKLPCGALKEGLASDMIVVTLPQSCELSTLPLHLILHTHTTHLTFIDGKQPC
ncbi:aminofutalosine deaminase family hydrolase [Sulfurospirillum barnesii]|uniref:Cytosine deaminase-like metal-dependent hydrolase n=1 Tax=Sulfurospirillum barnesii (strain ATCC 700032 / DSM 10660 / SES-3) TaxID=760154 RepID=I3XUL1_SULBS|nr:metal-dependent hydrolase [Sulfurospirillum barnesii]AFL67635.1 cytosine deaminase-like metal-dependent hydrolase [Sulfurospirillum barnesii SES-3]